MITSTSFLRLLLAFLLLCPITFGQDQRRQSVQRNELRTLMSRVDVDVPETEVRTNQPRTYRELKIRWSNSSKSPNGLGTEAQSQAPISTVFEDKKRTGTLPRSRSLELAPTLLFVAAVDASNRLRWWSIMPDPRVVRLETPNATGELSRQDLYVSNVVVVVAFPDDPEIATLRFYHPVWNGTDFDLKPLAIVSLAR